MSALSRISNGTHRHFTAEKGDAVVITASVIPGNEKTIRTVVNTLMKTGVDVYHEQGDSIHVSGHASAEELKLMLSVTKPKFFMPVHGEYKHLVAHSKIAQMLNIKSNRIIVGENGDILELSKKEFRKKSKMNINDIYVDGKETGNVASSIIKDRHVMAREGVVFIIAVISEAGLVREPEILSKGFIGSRNAHVLNLITKEVNFRLSKMLADELSSKAMEAELRKRLQNMIFKVSRRNPVLDVTIYNI